MIGSFVNIIRAGAVAGVFFAAVQHAAAADVSRFYVRKGLLLEQSSATTIVTNEFQPAMFIARTEGKIDSISSVNLSTPSTIFSDFALDFLGNRFEYTVPATVDELNNFYFPAGNYTFTFESDNDGFSIATLAFPAGPFPAAVPQVLNYAAAQTINAGADFALNFTPFSGAAAGDYYELEVFDQGGDIVFFKTGPASTTSAAIPSGTLSSNEVYDAHLRFVHDVTTDTTSYPGATGTAGYFKENVVSLSTETGGGGADTTPPTLLTTTPLNGATGVAVNTQILFAFSEPMTPQQSIQWSANVNAANFTYSWLAGNQALMALYTGGLPANATITWTLAGGPTGFRDVAGNALPAGSTGSFSTGTGGGGTNNPCGDTNSVPSGFGSGVIFKSLEYVQVGNTAPTPNLENPASAFATYRAATNQTVSKVTVTGPNNINLTLTNIPFVGFFGSLDFPSGAALDAALPAGNYTITATGAGTATLFVTNVSAVPVPRISNLTELASINPTQDFVLHFSPFTGSTSQDQISIDIVANDGREFHAPDVCLNLPLANTATSVVIKANTFLSVQKLTGNITFSKFSSFNTNSIPSTYLSAMASVQTSFDVTGGSTGSQVSWTSATLLTNGLVSFGIQAPVGTNLVVEGTTNLTSWRQVATLPTTNGLATFTTDTKTNRNQSFRARTQ